MTFARLTPRSCTVILGGPQDGRGNARVALPIRPTGGIGSTRRRARPLVFAGAGPS
jgi:hypothetical protein